MVDYLVSGTCSRRSRVQSHIYVSDHHSDFGGSSSCTKMSGCTLRFAKNSPLRTTLVDESTGNIKYKIETPVKIARSVTRIRKFESPTQPPLHWDEDRNSDSGDDDITDGCKKNTSNHEEEEHEAEAEPQETSDEIARIYWKLFSSNRFILRGRITTRREFLPRCGKMKG